MFGTQLVALAPLPWTKGVSVPVGLAMMVVVAPVVVVCVPVAVGDEPWVMGAMVPVQADPIGQQAGGPALSAEHTLSLGQQRPG